MMNLSTEPMSISVMKKDDGWRLIVSAYCRSPTRFVGMIVARNDAPLIKRTSYQMDIPFNTSVQPVRCFNVSSITREVVTDHDGKFKGLAVIQATRSMYGRWKYRCGEGESFQMPVLSEVGKMSRNLSCILLGPSCW